MSAHPGKIEVCQDCDFKDTVCPDTCWIYQDLNAEYLNEMKRELDPVEDYNDYRHEQP